MTAPPCHAPQSSLACLWPKAWPHLFCRLVRLCLPPNRTRHTRPLRSHSMSHRAEGMEKRDSGRHRTSTVQTRVRPHALEKAIFQTDSGVICTVMICMNLRVLINSLKSSKGQSGGCKLRFQLCFCDELLYFYNVRFTR